MPRILQQVEDFVMKGLMLWNKVLCLSVKPEERAALAMAENLDDIVGHYESDQEIEWFNEWLKFSGRCRDNENPRLS